MSASDRFCELYHYYADEMCALAENTSNPNEARISDKDIQEFVKYMQKHNCKLIPINENTFKPPVNLFKLSYNCKTPDHIFIPNDFNIESIKIVDNNLSDHKLIKIKIKK